MRIKHFLFGIMLTCFFAAQATAQTFKLHSTDIAEGQQLATAHVFQGFGCEGDNLSPALSWSNPPAGTKSFALTVYDPDAPTGSGWWHWNVVNLPASVSSLPQGTTVESLPEGAMTLRNDYGAPGFGGACPPPGEVHRYQFTIHALGVAQLELPENPSNALAGFMIRANALDSATITAVYTR